MIQQNPTVEATLSDKKSQSEQILHLANFTQNNPFVQIAVMNKVFKVPEVEETLEGYKERLEQFNRIFKEEMEEIYDIFDNIQQGQSVEDTKVEIADWLGDMIVYCVSEMYRFDIPPTQILTIIMASNFSKLDDNGNAIFDERMKLMKGPHYWKPEPQIKEFLLKEFLLSLLLESRSKKSLLPRS